MKGTAVKERKTSRGRSKPDDSDVRPLCRKAEGRTWLNSRIKMQLEEKPGSEGEPPESGWTVLTWVGDGWRGAGHGREPVEKAFDFMKEINAHHIRVKERELFWQINCRKILARTQKWSQTKSAPHPEQKRSP